MKKIVTYAGLTASTAMLIGVGWYILSLIFDVNPLGGAADRVFFPVLAMGLLAFVAALVCVTAALLHFFKRNRKRDAL